MTIVCIKKYKSQGLQLELTYGKSYETVNTLEQTAFDHLYYHIVNDQNQTEYYSVNDFVKLDEWRCQKLKEIGI